MSEKYKFNDKEGVYFVTQTIVHWIDIFTRAELKHVIIKSLKHCQEHKGLLIHAWCLMSSHLHLIMSVSSKETPSDILRDLKKYTSKEIVETIKEINESRREWLLRAFEKAGEDLKRIRYYKVWQDGNQPKQLFSLEFTKQKIDYIHFNPVKEEIVDEPENYWYSSARDYTGRKGLIDVTLIE